VELILNRGVDVNEIVTLDPNRGRFFKNKFFSGRRSVSALHLAVEGGHFEVVKLLLKWKANFKKDVSSGSSSYCIYLLILVAIISNCSTASTNHLWS
jgi:hypothetical protein